MARKFNIEPNIEENDLLLLNINMKLKKNNTILLLFKFKKNDNNYKNILNKDNIYKCDPSLLNIVEEFTYSYFLNYNNLEFKSFNDENYYNSFLDYNTK